jgi:hypothetical protein
VEEVAIVMAVEAAIATTIIVAEVLAALVHHHHQSSSGSHHYLTNAMANLNNLPIGHERKLTDIAPQLSHLVATMSLD